MIDFPLLYKNSSYKFSVQLNEEINKYIIYFPQSEPERQIFIINNNENNALDVYNYTQNIFDSLSEFDENTLLNSVGQVESYIKTIV